ncbi:carboxylesterase [Bacillus carboniphilus]|uniref:Carboxylesterase n=1 Tax=Bacillus carboniphilus TaxID=86663 RepID=A0ABP3G6N9_9BACI
MKIVAPKPFMYEGGKRAVLLLHGFTGTTSDVKRLGQFLHERGYTCFAPVYKGHGQDPLGLISTDAQDWWQDAVNGYNHLKKSGYEEVAVAGVSLGGVFSLRISSFFPVKGVVSMSAPAQKKSKDDLFKRIIQYAERFKKFEKKDEASIASEMEDFNKLPMDSLSELQDIIVDTRERLSIIQAPALILRGMKDDDMYIDSADVIYNSIHSEQKTLKSYENSGHIITTGPERESVFEEVFQFLEGLDWKE